MIANPIIPIWVMSILSIGLLVFIFIKKPIRVTQIIIVILLFIINIRPMIPSGTSQTLASNLDVLFVIDTTISMNAEDYNGTNTRLSGVKKDCEYIIKSLSGARYSIITFSNSARIITPYTKDINTTIETIDILEPINQTYAKGSSLNSPIEVITQALKSSEKKDDKIRIIFFISDGEITDDSELESYKDISQYITNGAVLGYGTSNGGYMKARTKYSDEQEYIKYNNSKALSKIDESNLKSIAKDLGVSYIHMSNQNNITKKLSEIQRRAEIGLSTSNISTYDDIYYLFAIPLLVLLILELNKYRRNNI